MSRALLLVLCVWLPSAAYSGPLLRVLSSAAGATNLVRNGGFEETRENAPAGWTRWQGGYALAPGAGRNGSAAIRCENTASGTQSGVSQTLALNRAEAIPIVVRGWSKAENISGAPDSGYSVYVDIVYSDGTPLWGQTANFRCGTHDWQQREFVIVPERPVRSVTVYCLLRGHTGQAWFDDVSVAEITATGASVIFQGLPVASVPRATQQGRGGRVVDAMNPGDFMVRDNAAGSDFMSFQKGECSELGLNLSAQFVTQSNHIVVRGRVSDALKRDRAVTLVFALPVDATGWRWGDDIRRSRSIEGCAEYGNVFPVRAGLTGTQSLYPLAPIWSGRAGMALAIDMAHAAVYRVGYHAGLKQLFVAYDFGLAQETSRFPGGADFEFVLFRFDSLHGFRSAWQKLMEIFPEHFVVRSKEQGIWMPFTDVSKVQGWEDFGFRYHEGNNNVPWDDEHSVLSFRYTEPMTWWMRMPKQTSRSLEAAIRIRDEMAAGKDSAAKFASVSRSAAMFNDSGEPALQFQDTPWCDGAVWSLNPNPWLGGTGAVNGATLHWSNPIKEKLYGDPAKGRLDGEYLDSLEGYVTADLNFRREHFRATTVPLTFTSDTKAPVLFKGLAVFEFTKWMADDVHRMGKLMFANGVPYRLTYLCPWLDVLGTETDWLRGTKYQPASLAQMDLWRTLSGGKPYLLLMNSDYDKFTPELVESYFARSLFYGMWPSFFSHNASENPYWQNPRWYNRDRPLFRKYIPVVRRMAQAGWQPIPEARCDNSSLLIERFGPDANGTVFLTIFNDTALMQKGVVTMDDVAFRGKRAALMGDVRSAAGEKFSVTLPPQRVAVVEMAR